AVADLAAHFPDRPSQVIDSWFAYGPFVLDIGNVFADGLAICLSKVFSHSRTGSLPEAERLKIAGIFLLDDMILVYLKKYIF
ncbi:MAG: hypothetical protein ACK52H_00150, partial [Burkholderiales bacterium]